MNKISLLVFIILQAILWLYLGDAFLHPGKYVYTYGGDGAFIYFNMIFHTFFGDGFLLESMNFPKHESIFMTDAQASISLFFSELYKLFPSIFSPERVIAWSHRFHYLMIGFAGLFFFRSFATLGVNKYLSAIASVFITLLSPMMIRLAAGHFGLAYPFVFAFTFYFLIKTFLERKYSFGVGIGFTFVIVFFGLNNFYIGMINLTFSMLFGFFMLFIKRHRRKGLLLLTHVSALILVLYCMIHFTDPGMDRVEIQWGYEFNQASLRSFLLPPTSLMFLILSKFRNLTSLGMEAWINLGFYSLLSTGLALPLLLLRKIKFEKREIALLFIGFSLACLVMFLYASAVFYRSDLLRENLFHEIGLLTMFKASARFAWPVYFAFAFFAVCCLDKILKKIPQLAALILVTVMIIGSAFETHYYLGSHVFKNKYGNPYSQVSKNHFLQIVKDKEINLSQYQAIYSLPVMEGWNDKFQIVPHFQAEYNSILFSMSTGIPMLNGMLSRIGVTDAAKSIQMAAHPLVTRELLPVLQKDKAILLIYGKGANSLTLGEKYLLSQSSLLADEKEFQIRELEVEHLDPEEMISDYIAHFDSTLLQSRYHTQEGFDDKPSSIKFAGDGSLMITQDTTFLVDTISSLVDSIECSIFVKLGNEMFGNPQFYLNTLNGEGEVLTSKRFNAYTSRDYQKGWMRAATIVEVPLDASMIEVSAKEVNQNFILDEVCLKALNEKVKVEKANGDLLYDNYLIEE